jgi:hypothetical protein
MGKIRSAIEGILLKQSGFGQENSAQMRPLVVFLETVSGSVAGADSAIEIWTVSVSENSDPF